jgi:hypothetical protein
MSTAAVRLRRSAFRSPSCREGFIALCPHRRMDRIPSLRGYPAGIVPAPQGSCVRSALSFDGENWSGPGSPNVSSVSRYCRSKYVRKWSRRTLSAQLFLAPSGIRKIRNARAKMRRITLRCVAFLAKSDDTISGKCPRETSPDPMRHRSRHDERHGRATQPLRLSELPDVAIITKFRARLLIHFVRSVIPQQSA